MSLTSSWTSLAARARQCVLGIPVHATTFERRGFRATDPSTRERLEAIGRGFAAGHAAALARAGVDGLDADLQRIDVSVRAFAFEGAAMALALLDALKPWSRPRWSAFLDGPGREHACVVHVGAGWALARLRRDPSRSPTGADPLLEPLVADGYGFHEGYFAGSAWANIARSPRLLGAGAASIAIDQGLGRSLWFVEGADADAIARAIRRLEGDRHADAWSGVGVAAAFAGGVGRAELVSLKLAASAHRSELAQGAAFAAYARRASGDGDASLELACDALCGMASADAAAMADLALSEIEPDAGCHAYLAWQRQLRARFRDEVTA